ncbi:MAG TPA: glucokinase, partial [Desulfovibrio sp.]|nr:glucokinase [Desulfovibrio sp.]
MPRPGASSARHILAADIGGTSSRFGHFLVTPDGAISLATVTRLETAAADSFVDLLGRLPQAGFDLCPDAADAAVFAVPGAVVGRRVTFANIDWALDLDALADAF